MQTNTFSDLIGGDYQVIYADPPWKYYGDPNKPQAAGKHYDMMSFDELAALDVFKIKAKQSVLLCWTTSSMLQQTIELMPKWGFHYRGVHQVWVKTTLAGKVINGQGTRPSFIKPTSEFLLIGATTQKGRTLPIISENVENVILAPRPGNIHSRKPSVFRDCVTKLFGDVKRVELFARESAVGWDSWGNEINAALQTNEG